VSPAAAAVTAADLDRLDGLAAERGIALAANAAMAPLTTLRVGGAADRLLEATTGGELLAGLRLARDAGVACFVLGNGSDIVVAEAGIRGLVIRNRARGVAMDGTQLRADAGTPLALLVRRCAAAGLAGLEFGTSIPGTLGGAVWANAGAHGAEIGELISTVQVWDPADGSLRTLDAPACAFGYRESRFKQSGEIVLSALLQLRRDDPAAIAARVAANQAQRVATQPLADQNAGSVFRNPPGDHAGRLVDAAGLKGLRVGSAAVSELHANFIVTDRGGRAADVRALADRVRSEVRARFGIELAYEIEFVGAWPPANGPGGAA
jgi:UDP-N-acetylmuramate dehydrogenase